MAGLLRSNKIIIVMGIFPSSPRKTLKKKMLFKTQKANALGLLAQVYNLTGLTSLNSQTLKNTACASGFILERYL